MSAAAVVRVFPADVFDTLEFSALAFGGIGAGRYFERERDSINRASALDRPVCAIGHAHAVDPTREVEDTVRRVNIHGDVSDAAVKAINARRGVTPRKSRVSFTDWCAELGVVRGES